MTSQEIIKQFHQGRKFVNQKGQCILAVAEHEIGPALIYGSDEDTLAIKIEGVDYYSPEDHSEDFWDVVLAKELGLSII
jgi:hypothetical protein